jgi:hypothetical protein
LSEENTDGLLSILKDAKPTLASSAVEERYRKYYTEAQLQKSSEKWEKFRKRLFECT